MINICIIGAGGVGKAHAISAAKYIDNTSINGGRITIVDPDDDVLKMYMEPTWYNCWGPIHDEYNIPHNIEVVLSKKLETWNLSDDLYIISSPNSTHREYVEILKNRLVIVEKPFVSDINSIPWGDRVHYGIEWVHHPIIQRLKEKKIEDRRVTFIHGFPPNQYELGNNYHIQDLGTHVISILQYLGVELKPNPLILFQETDSSITTTIHMGSVRLKFGYDRFIPDDLLYVDGRRIEWIPYLGNDLFYRQIQYVLTNPTEQIFSKKQIEDQLKFLADIERCD